MGLGLGATVGSVLDEDCFLERPAEAAKNAWESITTRTKRPPQANGAVMRTAILGIPFFYDEARTIDAARRVCLITHWYAVLLWLAEILVS
jgi:ADP-ribosylglycohydrolase